VLHLGLQHLAVRGGVTLALTPATSATAVVETSIVVSFVTCFILCSFCPVSCRDTKVTTKWVSTVLRVT
jgi:hypothetical protein